MEITVMVLFIKAKSLGDKEQSNSTKVNDTYHCPFQASEQLKIALMAESYLTLGAQM